MNIYALKGHKVKCVTLSSGYKLDQKRAEEYLEICGEYTIDKTIVHSWSTDVWLQEFPDISFNSVFFEDIEEQPIELNKKHPDYIRFNRI